LYGPIHQQSGFIGAVVQYLNGMTAGVIHGGHCFDDPDGDVGFIVNRYLAGDAGPILFVGFGKKLIDVSALFRGFLSASAAEQENQYIEVEPVNSQHPRAEEK
jgi:hypothetical protein